MRNIDITDARDLEDFLDEDDDFDEDDEDLNMCDLDEHEFEPVLNDDGSVFEACVQCGAIAW